MSRLEAAFALRLSPAFALDVAFTLDLPPGAPVAALFGPSGSGKSTVLSVLAGLRRPDRGRAALDGTPLVDVERGTDLPPERRAVGLVAQDGLLFPHLDVARNLAYAERRRGARAAPSREDVLDTLRLHALLDRRPSTLSGGERQRVALARALLSGPRLLLLDEPVSALDGEARREALRFVDATLRRFRVPALLVTHQEEEALRFASRVVRMDGGRVVAEGPAEEVLRALPAGAGVANLFRATFTETGGDRARGPGGMAIRLPRTGAVGEEVWCRLPSGAIALEPPAGRGASSARNRVPGRVVALWREAHGVRVAVDAGTVLQVDLTEDAAAELRLAEGREVRCVFKVHAIEVIP